ncbi:unnamed protein product [Aphanomyces euteiches]
MGCVHAKAKYEEKRAEKIGVFVHLAIQGNIEKIAEAIKNDAKLVVAKDRFGMTALHWACYVGQLDAAIALCSAGAQPTQLDVRVQGNEKGRLSVVDHLIRQCHMKVNEPSGNGDTPLHKAVLGPCIPVILLLLKHGANKHALNTYGRSPRIEVEFRMGTLKASVDAAAIFTPEEEDPGKELPVVEPVEPPPCEPEVPPPPVVEPPAEVVITTAVVPFNHTLSHNSSLRTLESPRNILASFRSLTGYSLVNAIFDLHDRVLEKDQGATIQFRELVASHCHPFGH